MIGLLAAMLGHHRIVPLGTGRDLSQSRIRPLSREDAERLAAGVPGPPAAPEWDDARAPLPDLPLVSAGMRPISGGRRRSF